MAAAKTIDLTRFTLKFDRERGFFSEKYFTPRWQPPDVCACCGAASEGSWRERIESDRGDKRFWLDIEAPYCNTCLDHVEATERLVRSAKRWAFWLAVLLGIAAFGALIALSGDPFEDEGDGAAIVLLSMCSYWFIFHPLIKRHMRRKAGESMERNEYCSVKLHFEMASKGFVASKLLLHVTSGCEAFCERFRELNAGLIESEEAVQGHVQRTAGGGFIVNGIKKARRGGQVSS